MSIAASNLSAAVAGWPPARSRNSVGKFLNGTVMTFFLRDDAQHVEDEAVVFEGDEIDVLTAGDFDGAPQRRIRQHGRALLGQFDEQNAARRLSAVRSRNGRTARAGR